MDSFPDGFHALIVGASRGIGLALTRALLNQPRCTRVHAACRDPARAAGLAALLREHPDRLGMRALDVSAEKSIADAADAIRAHSPRLHLLINAAGLLHDLPGLKPERRLEDLRAESLMRSFAVNAVGPILTARYFAPLLTHPDRAVFANLSARVGSISDNRLGGWYAYRAAKAAQNQFTRTLAVEMARRAPQLTVLALHPGTVDTDLSRPFQSAVPAGKLFDADRAASQLLSVIDGASPSQSGRFFAWDGAEIPW